MGDHGVANVSMRQIRIAAGQRNESAVQYHFDDLDGLLRALGERHGPGVQEIQDRIVAAQGTRPSLRKLVDALARPIAEYATRGPSERAWVKIMADLIADPRLSFETVRVSQTSEAVGLGVAAYERLREALPEHLAVERIWAVAQFVIYITADRARLQDDPEAARPLISDAEFVDNVVTMAYGALTARSPAPRRD